MQLYSGVSRGVIYPQDSPGVSWQGLTTVDERSEGRSGSSYFFDGVQTSHSRGSTEYSARFSCYTAPSAIFGFQHVGLSYTTGRQIQHVEGYDIHLIYDIVFNTDAMTYQTTNDKINPSLYSFEGIGQSIELPQGIRGTHFIIPQLGGNPDVISDLEKVLYGYDGEPPRLPTFEELEDIFQNNATLMIIDHGDGTWTASGPDDVVSMIADDEFQIDWPSVVMLNNHTYQVSSL